MHTYSLRILSAVTLALWTSQSRCDVIEISGVSRFELSCSKVRTPCKDNYGVIDILKLKVEFAKEPCEASYEKRKDPFIGQIEEFANVDCVSGTTPENYPLREASLSEYFKNKACSSAESKLVKVTIDLQCKKSQTVKTAPPAVATAVQLLTTLSVKAQETNSIYASSPPNPGSLRTSQPGMMSGPPSVSGVTSEGDLILKTLPASKGLLDTTSVLPSDNTTPIQTSENLASAPRPETTANKPTPNLPIGKATTANSPANDNLAYEPWWKFFETGAGIAVIIVSSLVVILVIGGLIVLCFKRGLCYFTHNRLPNQAPLENSGKNGAPREMTMAGAGYYPRRAVQTGGAVNMNYYEDLPSGRRPSAAQRPFVNQSAAGRTPSLSSEMLMVSPGDRRLSSSAARMIPRPASIVSADESVNDYATADATEMLDVFDERRSDSYPHMRRLSGRDGFVGPAYSVRRISEMSSINESGEPEDQTHRFYFGPRSSVSPDPSRRLSSQRLPRMSWSTASGVPEGGYFPVKLNRRVSEMSGITHM